MAKRFRTLPEMLRDCLENFVARPRKGGRRACSYRPVLEGLETRIAPATLSEDTVQHALTITLDGINESVAFAATANTYTAHFTNGIAGNGGVATSRVTGFGTASVTITSAGVAYYNTINVLDLTSGTAVSFSDSGANPYDASFNIDLSNPFAGGISFNGTSNFSAGLSVATTIGNITSAASSAINVTGFADTLTMITNSNINLLGSTNVPLGSADLSADGNINTGASFTVANTANLTASDGSITTGALTAPNGATLSATGNITLSGAVNSANGSTLLEANGAITANAGNNFGSALYLVGAGFAGSATSALVNSAGPLVLGQAALTGGLTVTAGGAITQNAPLTVGGAASFTTSTGAITLNSGNLFAGDISAGVNLAGSDNITLNNIDTVTNGLEVGTITMGSGVLQLDNSSSGFSPTPSVTEDPAGGGITDAAGGSVIVNVTNAYFGANVLLTSAANDISPGANAVTINGSFSSGDLGYRNTNAAASPNDLTLNNFTVNNLTLEFDNNTAPLDVSTLPIAFSQGLTVLNDGDIDQPTAAITVNGNASFTSMTGNVLLNNPGNTFSGDISASVVGSNDITLDNSAPTTTLGTISLGSGTLTIDDDDGSGSSMIAEDPAASGIAMTGAGVAIVNVAFDASASVLLNGAANDIAGTLTVNGVATTGTSGDFTYRNTYAAASLSSVTVGTLANPFTIDDLTVEFDAAPIDVRLLPAFSAIGNLSVTAGGTGISQSGGTIATSGAASFTVLGSGNPAIALGASNAITGPVSFSTPATDTGSVTFTNTAAIQLASSTLGVGAFNVTANTGNITENAGATITQGPSARAATYTATAGASIDLSMGSKNIFTGQVVYIGAGVNFAGLENSYAQATFGSLRVPAGITSGTETLIFDNPLASIILPTQSIAYSLNLTEGDNIVSLAGTTFTVTGSGNQLSLTSQNGNIDLLGALIVAGTTTLEVDDLGSTTPSLSATNPANNFGASLGLNPSNGAAAVINVVAAAGLTLAASSSAGGSLSATALNGAITQTGILGLNGSASFTATGGNITLANAANVFAADLSASVSGGDSITLFNANATTTLGTISLGSGSTLGTLTIDDVFATGASSISEDPAAGGIRIVPTSTTPTTANFTLNDLTGSVDLSGAANDFGPHVAIDVNGINVVAVGTTTGGFGFRNTNPAASLAQVAFNNFAIANFLTIEFDTTSLDAHNLPTFASGSALTLTAGGPITESGGTALAAASGSFNVLGDFGITLTNVNTIAGAISFSDPDGDNQANVAYTNAGNVLLGSSNLGLGKFTVTSSTGTIVEQSGDAIVQSLGGGAVLFQAAGAAIDLSAGQDNDFSGPVTFTGSGANNLTTIGFENADNLATLPRLTASGLAASLASVIYTLDNAPIALPSITTAALSVTAGGNITQQASLTVTGLASFTAEGVGLLNSASFGIQLTNPANSFNTVSLNNSGESAVAITTTGGLTFDGSTLGSGALTVVANGPITQANGQGIVQVLGPNDQLAGVASFAAGNFPILLDNANNQFLGPIAVKTGASGNVNIENAASVVLGNDSVGGRFSVTDLITAADGITQAPGTSITVAGSAYFAGGGGGITLTNPGNSIGAGQTVSLNTTSGNAALTVTGAVELAASSVGGQLSVTAGGAITQLPGLALSGNDGVLDATGASFMATGAGATITLTNAGNDFGGASVSLSAPGAVSLTDNDANALTLGLVNFGGSLSIIATAAVDGIGAIIGAGAVSIANSSVVPANAINVTLNGSNNISGTGSFTLTNVNNVALTNAGNIGLAGTFASTANVDLTAGGTVTLPNTALTLGSLTVTANTTTIINNLTTTASDIDFTGAVSFLARVTLDVTAVSLGAITFNGNVSTNNPLTFNLPASGSLNLNSGAWNEGAAPITINGAGAQFNIGGGSAPATFEMGSSTLNFTGVAATNAVNVDSNGTFGELGNMTISDGGADGVIDVNFNAGSTFLADLGPNVPNPGLILGGLNAANQIDIARGAMLGGFGTTAHAIPILSVSSSTGGNIVGTFSNPTDASGDLLLGTDIVQATYSNSALSITQGGTVATSGTVTGSEVDGDGYKVAVTGGSGLVVIADSSGGLDIVVRTASVATTLTITTTPNGGNAFTRVDGIAIDGTGAVTINAATTNVTGNIIIGGPLTALTLNNWQSGTLTAAGGGATQTSITGNLFDNDVITLASTLAKLTVAEFTSAGSNAITPSISAASFGTLKTTGNAAANSAGNFSANLVDASSEVTALTAATIKGTLSGNWDLAGTVGAVTAAATLNWNLGLVNGPGIRSAGLLTSVASLSLGAASAVTINAAGKIVALTAISLNDYNSSANAVLGTIQAASFGTIATTGSAALGDHGNLVANLTATGNAGGTSFQALTSLTVNGDLGISGVSTPDTLLFQNGNVGAITVLRQVNNVFIDAVPTTNGGAITTITAGQWPGSNLTAKSVGTWRITGNLAAQMLGDFTSSTVTLTGVPGSTAATLGTFSTAHDVSDSSFTIVNGKVTGFFVGSTSATVAAVGELQGTDITLESASAGNLGAITAAQWQDSNVTAETIGTLKVWARPAAAASTSALNGDMLNSNILAFETVGLATPGIGTFFVAGQLATTSSGGNYVVANNGITSFTVGRNVGASGTSFQVSADLNGGAGGIGTLTAGSWTNTDLAAAFLTTVNITGFTTADQSTGSVNGDFTDSNVVINGSNSAAPKQGIAAMTVKGQLNTTFFNVPAGIGTLAVTGAATNNFIDVANALTAASGALTTFTAGNINLLTLDANTAGTIQTTANLALGLAGSVTSMTAAISGFTGLASAPVGLGTLAVAGNFANDTLQVKDGIGVKFSVAQTLSNSTLALAYDSTNANANVKLLSAGAWSSTNLVADSVSTFNVTGNASFALAGNLSSSRITLLGALVGAAMGTFSATGSVSASTFQVASGNVTSFSTASFKNSNLYVGYRIMDPNDPVNDMTNNQSAINWEGNFLLGTFKTTAVLNPLDIPDTAAFQNSNVVAAKLGANTFTGLLATVPPGSAALSYVLGFRGSLSGAAGTLIVSGVSKPSGFVAGAFKYFGLLG